MSHAIWFQAPLTCLHCGSKVAPHETGLHTSSLNPDYMDREARLGDNLELHFDDLADGYFLVTKPDGPRVRALETWGCPACAWAQWATIDLRREDEDHHVYVAAEAVPLSPETLRGVHFLSRSIDFWLESNPGPETDAILSVIAHVLPRPSHSAGVAWAPPRDGYLLLSSGAVARLGETAQKPATLWVGKTPASAARLGDGLVVAHENGLLTVLSASSAGLAKTIETRDADSRFVAVAMVVVDGSPYVAAATSTGVIALHEPATLELNESLVLYRHRTEEFLPTGMLGDGTALVIASSSGYLRRVEPQAPEAWDAYLSTRRHGVYFKQLLALASGALVALTDDDEALGYELRAPSKLPERLGPTDRRLEVIAEYDATRFVALDSAGTLWLVDATSKTVAQVAATLATDVAGMCRIGATLVVALRSGILGFYPLVEDEPNVRLGQAKNVELGVGVVAVV